MFRSIITDHYVTKGQFVSELALTIDATTHVFNWRGKRCNDARMFLQRLPKTNPDLFKAVIANPEKLSKIASALIVEFHRETVFQFEEV